MARSGCVGGNTVVLETFDGGGGAVNAALVGGALLAGKGGLINSLGGSFSKSGGAESLRKNGGARASSS